MVLQESELLLLLVITRYVKGSSVLSCRESKNGFLVTVHCFIVQATAEAICRRIGVFESNEDTTGITLFINSHAFLLINSLQIWLH